MKLTKENVFISITDESLKDVFFTRPIEHNLELALFCLPEVLNGNWKKVVRQVKQVFKKYPVRRHIHGPFMGIEYDSRDIEVCALAEKKVKQGIEIAGEIGAEHIVLHSTFHPLNPDPRYKDVWIHRSIAFWSSLVPFAEKHNCMIVLENVFDRCPDMIQKIIEDVNSPYFKACLDVGHAHIFGEVSLPEWLSTLKQELYHLHVHDNGKVTDDHLGIGQGTIEWDTFFAALEVIRHVPAFTIEVKDIESAERSLQYLQEHSYME